MSCNPHNVYCGNCRWHRTDDWSTYCKAPGLGHGANWLQCYKRTAKCEEQNKDNDCQLWEQEAPFIIRAWPLWLIIGAIFTTINLLTWV